MTDLPSTEPNTAARPAVPGARLAVRGATIICERHVISHNLNVGIPAGVFIAVMGPNACGRSTLLRALARLHRPARGAVLLGGADVVRLGARKVAHRVGLLPQSTAVPGGMLVHDLVARGCFPHQGLFRQWSQQGRQAVEKTMEMVEVTELATRPVDELNDGQRQRVWIALALTQSTETILPDEPTTFLDLAYQVDILQLCRRLNTNGHMMVAVLHGLNQAARCAERMIVMREGRVRITSSPHEILTEDLIGEVSDLAAVITPDPMAGTPMVVPRHLGAAMPAGPDPIGTRSASIDSIRGPTPQSSADPASVGTNPAARSQQNGRERNTDR